MAVEAVAEEEGEARRGLFPAKTSGLVDLGAKLRSEQTCWTGPRPLLLAANLSFSRVICIALLGDNSLFRAIILVYRLCCVICDSTLAMMLINSVARGILVFKFK